MTNPIPEQIEAAAKALEKLPINLITRQESREAATAALVAAAGVAPRAEYHRGYQEGLLQAGMAMQASIDAGELVAAAGVAPCSELLCPLHHDGDSSPRNRADERTDNNLVDESPDRQTCNKSGNDGHDHFRSVHNAQGSNGADSPTPGVTPQEPGEPHDCTGLAMIGEIESLKQLLDTHRQRADFWERRYKEATQVDEAKLADMLETHQAGFSEGGSFDGCQCGEDFEGNDGAGSGHPAHQAKMLSVTLRGGGR